MKEIILDRKKKKIEEIIKLFNKSISIIFIDLLKLNSDDITYMRKICYNNNCFIKVIKNNLIIRALQKSIFSKIFVSTEEKLFSNILICSQEHIAFIIRLLIQNNNLLNKLNIKLMITNFKIFKSDNLLSDLIKFPTYNEIISKLILILRKISICDFLSVLLKIK